MTPDGVPIVDYAPNYKNLILAVGMCGQGLMLGPGLGKNIAAMITTGKPVISQEAQACFRYERDLGENKSEALR